MIVYDTHHTENVPGDEQSECPPHASAIRFLEKTNRVCTSRVYDSTIIQSINDEEMVLKAMLTNRAYIDSNLRYISRQYYTYWVRTKKYHIPSRHER